MSDNKFIELTENLYDARIKYNSTYDQRLAEIEQEKKELEASINNKSWFSKFKKKEEEPITSVSPDLLAYQNAYNEIKNFFNDILSNPSQTFWTLWQVCQFVRWAEKIFIYDNDPEKKSDIFVDSEMNSDERQFKISTSKFNLFVILRLVKRPNASFAEKQYNEVISIKIERLYGKKMESKLQIINGETDGLDDSDLYLISQINYTIHKALRSLFESVLLAVGGKLYTDDNNFPNVLNWGYYF